MNASPARAPGADHPIAGPAGADARPWQLGGVVVGNWLAFSLLNFLTGPGISRYEALTEDQHTVAISMGHIISKTLEIRLVNKLSQPLLKIAIGASEDPEPSLAVLAWSCIFFQAVQAAPALAARHWEPGLIPVQALPKAYFARLKFNLEVDLAGEYSAALDQTLSLLMDKPLDTFANGFSRVQDGPPAPAPAWSSQLKDGLIFSLFHLLKAATAPAAQADNPLHVYLEMVADEGMVLSSSRTASVIVDYLIECREQALEAALAAIPSLAEMQDASVLALEGSRPSQAFVPGHRAMDFIKELLTMVAIAAPATGAGIHLLPRILDGKGLAFSMLMETSTNVLILLIGRCAVSASDYLSEQTWSTLDAVQTLFPTRLPTPNTQTLIAADTDPMREGGGLLIGVTEAPSVVLEG